jgi:hypothetical protein
VFNVRPEWDLPGLHNFKPSEEAVLGLHNFRPPEEAVPGFRRNANGSRRQTPVSVAPLVPDVGGWSLGLSDDAALAAVPASERRPSLCPLVGRAGPHCVYQCSPTEWIYYTPPFQLNRAAHSLYPASGLVLGEAGHNFQVRGLHEEGDDHRPRSKSCRGTREAIRGRQGLGYVPVIEWQKGDSSYPHFVPQFALCFEKRDLVDPSRAMECDGKDVAIYQYAPDELFGTNGQKVVDVKDGMLVIVDERESFD